MGKSGKSVLSGNLKIADSGKPTCHSGRVCKNKQRKEILSLIPNWFTPNMRKIYFMPGCLKNPIPSN
jgi:hypothetical protein